MVVLRTFLLIIVSSLLFLSSCTNDQLVEVFEQPPVVVSPNYLLGTWELDSVKITTKEHPPEDGVAYEVLVWRPNPDEKDTLKLMKAFLLGQNTTTATITLLIVFSFIFTIMTHLDFLLKIQQLRP